MKAYIKQWFQTQKDEDHMIKIKSVLKSDKTAEFLVSSFCQVPVFQCK